MCEVINQVVRELSKRVSAVSLRCSDDTPGLLFVEPTCPPCIFQKEFYLSTGVLGKIQKWE